MYSDLWVEEKFEDFLGLRLKVEKVLFSGKSDLYIKEVNKTVITPFLFSEFNNTISKSFFIKCGNLEVILFPEPTKAKDSSYSFSRYSLGSIYFFVFNNCTLICLATSLIIGIATELPTCLYNSDLLLISLNSFGNPIIL